MQFVADWAHLADISSKEDETGKTWSTEDAKAKTAQWLRGSDIRDFPNLTIG